MSKYKLIADNLPIPEGIEIGVQEHCCAGFHYDPFKQEWYANKEYLDINSQWVKKIEEPEVKEGQYWVSRNTGTVYRINKVNSYGIYFDGVGYSGSGFYSLTKLFILHFKLLTDKEIEQALFNEFHRRFSEGDQVQGDWWPDKYKNSSPIEITLTCPSYDSDRDILYHEGWAVYEQGQWAEIIEDEWEVIGLDWGRGCSVRSTDHYVNLFSMDGIPIGLDEEQAEAIADALNELEQNPE